MRLRKASEPIHRTNSIGYQWRTKEYFIELHKEGKGFTVEFGDARCYIKNYKFTNFDDAEEKFESLKRVYEMDEDKIEGKTLGKEVVIFT